VAGSIKGCPLLEIFGLLKLNSGSICSQEKLDLRCNACRWRPCDGYLRQFVETPDIDWAAASTTSGVIDVENSARPRL
jgi:hypothetical protein